MPSDKPRHPWVDKPSPWDDDIVENPLTGERVKVADLDGEMPDPITGESVKLRDAFLQRMWMRSSNDVPYDPEKHKDVHA